MEEDNVNSPTGNERRGLAIAALIMAAVAMFCAFVVSWREFAILVAGLGLVVGLFVVTKVKGPGRSKNLSLAAIFVSLAAAAIALYYLSTMVPQYDNENEVPVELSDTAVERPDNETLDRLRMSMDTSQTE